MAYNPVRRETAIFGHSAFKSHGEKAGTRHVILGINAQQKLQEIVHVGYPFLLSFSCNGLAPSALVGEHVHFGF